MKNLPIGIQSFSKLRTNSNDYLYVDKTRHIYNMVSEGNVYFLSRPRRFGKSLLVSAMNELFNGNKDIFEGLYIYDKWDWTKKNPVIRLDFGARANKTPQDLTISLSDFLNFEASDNGIRLESSKLPDKFGELITKLHLSTGEKVVVLIDEYDKPIIDNMSQLEVAESNKRLLHDFYQVLKAEDDHLRFVFMTGVSKFAGLSVFSALNNINDITIDAKYAAICGYTQEELESVFSEHIKAAAKVFGYSQKNLMDTIRSRYDGYSWDGEITVYNPFSTLLFFDKRVFDSYWFATGTPTFLIDMIKNRNQVTDILEPQEVGKNFFKSADVGDMDDLSLLFQTGYLTIKSKKRGIDNIYTLGMPNLEVREAFLENLLSSYSKYPAGKVPILRDKMQAQIRNSDEQGLEQSFRLLYAYIPYLLKIENEKYYQSMFLVMLALLGFDIYGEMLTNAGRIDAVLRLSDFVVISEFKYSAEKSLEEMTQAAIEQIIDKKYYERFLDKTIIMLGVAFNGKDVKCKMEKLKIK
ncbi:MAG: ATP-binding protein [Elusimicrobiota bacterium]|jgi:hypothetical protein|nr:ATP-binding protein [Elusimicrobiota bacterium]